MSKSNLPLPLTEKEKAVLEFIEVNLAESGVSPSYQEIRDHFGFASFNSVQNYLKQLANKGYVQVASNQKRAIQVLHPSHAVADAINKLVNARRTLKAGPRGSVSLSSERRDEVVSLPLLGRVAAGLPIEEFEYNETVDVPPSLVRNPSKSFALKVKGSSMIDDGIHDGDLVLVQKQTTASNGEIVVATIDNEATLKRIYFHTNDNRNGKKIELRPSNPSMESMWFNPDQVEIRGILTGLLRKF